MRIIGRRQLSRDPQPYPKVSYCFSRIRQPSPLPCQQSCFKPKAGGKGRFGESLVTEQQWQWYEEAGEKGCFGESDAMGSCPMPQAYCADDSRTNGRCLFLKSFTQFLRGATRFVVSHLHPADFFLFLKKRLIGLIQCFVFYCGAVELEQLKGDLDTNPDQKSRHHGSDPQHTAEPPTAKRREQFDDAAAYPYRQPCFTRQRNH